MSPFETYTERLNFWREAHARAARRFRQLGNARLLSGIAAVVIAGCSFGAEWISAWWLLAPLGVFIILAVIHERIDRARASAARGIAYFDHVLARLGNQWIGRGSTGERFRDPKHVYADDLDLFGRGSLFELLSTARTATGENVLAKWLLAPDQREQVIARQQAVAELRPRVDLREEFALMGEDIRTAVDAKALAEWGETSPAEFFKGARIIAATLAAAAVITFALFLAHVLSLIPFLIVILIELGFNLAIREAERRVVASASAPSRELRLLALLLERLERESFSSARLVELKNELQPGARPASREIIRLQRMVEQLETAGNMFFRPIAAPVLWVAQYAMAIEAWRERNGSRIGRWSAAIGEFEALCSLASFAYERPSASFPELIAEGPKLEAVAITHPLIPPDVAVPNDVEIGGPGDDRVRLWIVSGSNMSGKSTLLRSVGLNAVLAWAGAPVTAAQLRVSRVYIGASMRANDSVTDNRSRFYAEISRLRDVVELARAGKPTLFLLDELLSGTNSHDRRIGAEAVVRGLLERGAVGLVTTHDLALAQIVDTLDGQARNVHFEDHLEGGEIRFDYRLREGVVTRSNALELMRAVGLDV